MRALARALSDPALRPEQDTGESRPIGELPLLHHEVSHRLAKGEDMKSLGHPLGLCDGICMDTKAFRRRNAIPTFRLLWRCHSE
eukprot:g19728.t1